jgi:hypothetical protein
VISTQSQAKEFFVYRIATQAETEIQPLSENERWMLRFSESDPDFVVETARVEQFEAEIATAEFERKIIGLLQRAYQNDLKTNASTDARYREAARILNQGEHYLSVMIDQALKPATGTLDRLSLVLTALAVSGCLFIVIWALSRYLGHVPTDGELGVYMWVALSSAAVVYLFLRLILGGAAVERLIDRTLRVIFRPPN